MTAPFISARASVNCVLVVTIAIVFSVSLSSIPARAEGAGAGVGGTVSTKETIDGEEKTWGVDSTERSLLIYPSNYGDAGLFRVRSAEGLPEKTLTFGIGGEFYKVRNTPVGPADTIAESLFVGYSPVEHLTLGLQRRNSSTTFGAPSQLISSLGDLNLTASYSIRASEILAIAPLVNLLIASNFNALNPAGTTISVGAGVAATLSLFRAVGVPLFLHANLIYHMPQIRDPGPAVFTTQNFFSFSRYNTLTLALGAELKLGDFIPFLEYHQMAQFSSPVSFGSSPGRLTLGSRITPLENKSLAITLGMDIGTGKGIGAGVPFTPDWQIIGQVSYTVALSSTERKHYYTTKDVKIVDRRFIIGKTIDFEVNSATLTAGSRSLLDEIADVIRKNKIQKLLISGHTDSTAAEEYNNKLSQGRAQAVKDYLVSKGIDSSALVAQGLGKRKPKATNLTEQGRASNRRVEFFILEQG